MTTNRLDENLQVMLIANNLKTLRKAANLSVADVAEVIGKTRQAYNNYENGKREIGVLDLMSLSELYKLPIDLIVGSKRTSGENGVIAFDHYEVIDNEIVKTTPKYMFSSNDDVILVTNDENTIRYYLKTQNFNEKIETLFSYNNNIYSSILYKSPNGTVSFTTDKVLKVVPKENISNIIILGIYAGTINKDFNIPDFF